MSTASERAGRRAVLGRQALDGTGALRRALTDPARPQAARTALVGQLFGGKISAQALEILTAAVSGRWVSGRDLGDALDQLSVEAEVAYADAGARWTRSRTSCSGWSGWSRSSAALSDEAERPRLPVDRTGRS